MPNLSTRDRVKNRLSAVQPVLTRQYRLPPVEKTSIEEFDKLIDEITEYVTKGEKVIDNYDFDVTIDEETFERVITLRITTGSDRISLWP